MYFCYKHLHSVVNLYSAGFINFKNLGGIFRNIIALKTLLQGFMFETSTTQCHNRT